MRLRSERVVVVMLVAGLVALAAGCGGGGKKSSTSTSSGGGGTTHAATTTVASGGSGTPSFASAKNCQDLAGLAAKASSALTAAGGNPATALKTEAGILQGLANAAPSDIRTDFETLATAFSGFVSTLEKSGYKPGSTATPSAAQIAALTKAAKTFDTAKIRAAEAHLNTWAKQNCKGVHVGG
jgi:hypothetical protein